MKPNYLIIPGVVLVTAWAGSWVTAAGMAWYRGINLPAFTPAGNVIGAVWTGLFILAAWSALLVFNKLSPAARRPIMVEFFINALLNVLWTFLFFGLHLLTASVFEAVLLALSVLLLILMIYPRLRLAAWLLAPYFAWVSFATYLTWSIARLN